MQIQDIVQNAAAYLHKNLPQQPPKTIGIIAGTGLGGVVDLLEDPIITPYTAIPNFPVSTVESHAGQLVVGSVADTQVYLFQGRFHLYEGYSPAQVVMSVRTLGVLGVKKLILTNAAGAINPLFHEGEIMAITDHINFTGTSPLIGPNVDNWGPRFPDASEIYSRVLLDLCAKQALQLGIPLYQGVYAGVVGPNLETPAETRMFKMLGADAIGMSTVMEALAAMHMGMDILGLSCLANQNLPDCMAKVSLEQVVATAGAACDKLVRLLSHILPQIA
ncbi:purine-nucleoside phosphorylase [Desulfovibrio inopinatus]|uniref:purine-nucleoside phosphorylase n=1 Tax=Desulfovibrio inopinatus TaxID=102109 RepID=UPI0003F79919|nr:purine-nucleoside phosphorylase [Desulfovibrio inopinatus]